MKLGFTYKADLHCEKCGREICQNLNRSGKRPADPEDEYSYDSDDYPKTIVVDGESDTPQHCSTCGVFLENSLTSDGVNYVREAIADGSGSVVAEWADFYKQELG